MLKPIVHWWQINSLIIAIVITLLIAISSLINGKSLHIDTFNISDKVLHFSAYTILIIAWLFANKNLKKSYSNQKVFIFLSLFGIIIELLQGLLTNYRTMDWKDVLANTLGLSIGLVVYNSYIKRLQ